MDKMSSYTCWLLNSPVTLEWWIFRFHEWTFLFNYTLYIRNPRGCFQAYTGLMFNSTSTLWAAVWNQTILVTIFSSLKSSKGSSRLYHSECLSSLMTTELLMSQQKIKNGPWANVNWNTFHSSQGWDIHSEWKNSSTVLIRELLARWVVSWWRF